MTPRRPDRDEVVVAIRGTGPGAGFSGIVVDGGEGYGPAVGDEVFGTLPAGHAGDPLVVCDRRTLVRKPAALAHAEAAVLAGAGPVALRATRLSGARLHDRVLITGANSDAGAIAVQIAKARGSHVTALCCARDVPLLWDLGADAVIARERGAGESAPFAAVIDTDQSVTPELAAQLLDADGRLIALRDGAIHVATGSGAPVAVLESGSADQVELDELVELCERDGVFPAPR